MTKFRIALRLDRKVLHGPLTSYLPHLPDGFLFPVEAGLVSEHFSQAPQKLSFYSWYGSTRLFHFRVPPDTVLLRWLLHVSQGGPSCTDVEITV